MAAATPSKTLSRINGILGLFIGIFGALAILGVFFKIAKYPNHEIFMAIGFFGEAAAFVVMGIVSLVTGFTAKGEAPASPGLAPSGGTGVDFDAALRETADEFRDVLQSASQSYRTSMDAAAGEFRSSMQAMLHEHLGGDLEAVARSVQEDVRHFGTEMRGLGGEMARARSAVQAMGAEMESVATGTLADDAELLGRGMRQLSEGMAEAGSTVDRMRADLNEMALRFHAFNEGYKPTENGVGTSVTSRSDKARVA